MKTLGLISLLALAAAISAFAQSTNQPSLQGSITRLRPLGQPEKLPKPVLSQPSTGGLVPNLRRGTLLKPPPQTQWWSPVQNPELDVLARPPRGLVLWSYNF